MHIVTRYFTKMNNCEILRAKLSLECRILVKLNSNSLCLVSKISKFSKIRKVQNFQILEICIFGRKGSEYLKPIKS